MPPTIKVKLENGAAKIYQTPDPVKLDYDQEVTISLEGFSSAAQITKVDIFDNKIENGQDKKNQKLGTWNRTSPGTEPINDVTISVSGNAVKLKDTDTSAEKRFWYCLTVHDGTRDYDADPELIVKKQE